MKRKEFKEITEGAKALFFFRPYTDMARWFEIALGIFAWLNMGVIVKVLIQVVIKIIQIF